MKRITAEEAYQAIKEMPLKLLTRKNAYKDKEQFCLVGYLANKFNRIDLQMGLPPTSYRDRSIITKWYDVQEDWMPILCRLHIHEITQNHKPKKIVKAMALKLLKRYFKK